MSEAFSYAKTLKSLEGSTEPSKSYKMMFNTIEYQIGTIVDKINNIDSLDVQEIKSIIVRQHTMILNHDLFLRSSESRSYAQALFSNKRFLQIFLDIAGLLELSEHEIVCMNKLAYDYYIQPDKDPEVVDLLLRITYQVNNILVVKLSGILGMNAAKVLAMISKSTFRDEKKVHRINTFLIKCGAEFSVQNIIDLYCILFDGKIKSLFIYSMLEAKPTNLSNLQYKVFDNISIALLELVNSMTSSDIMRLLYEYAYTIILMKNEFSIRFPIKSMVSYTRIIDCINVIEAENNGDNLRIP